MADVVVVVVEQIGPVFGESVGMLDCLGVKTGYFVMRGYVTEEQIVPLVKGTVLEGYSVVEDDPVQLRESLLYHASKEVSASVGAEDRTGSVSVDHYFDVKGVGTVVLGCVADGSIRRHDTVKVLPLGGQAEIRSIQKHDDDFDIAGKGDRVGLALKGINMSDLDRGTVLSTDERLVARRDIDARASLVKYWLNPLREGMIVHIGHWMQFEPARIESVDPGGQWRTPKLRLKLQKDLVYQPGARAVITYLEGGKLRVIGTLEMQ